MRRDNLENSRTSLISASKFKNKTAIWCHLSLTARRFVRQFLNHFYLCAFAGHTFNIIFTLNDIERVSISTINMLMYTAPTKKDAAQYRMTNDSWTCIKSHDGALNTVAEAQVQMRTWCSWTFRTWATWTCQNGDISGKTSADLDTDGVSSSTCRSPCIWQQEAFAEMHVHLLRLSSRTIHAAFMLPALILQRA